MTGNADALSFNIIAVNAASPELVKLQKDLQDTAKAVSQHGQTVAASSSAGAKGMKDFSDSIRPVLAATRGMAAEIGSTLNPALGNMVGSLGLVARGAGAMGAAVAGVTAGVIVGAVAFKSYLDVVTAAAESQAKLNMAVKAFDLASIQTAMLATSAELEKRSENWKTFGGSVMNLFRTLTDAAGLSRSAVAELNAELAASEKVLPLARLKSTTEALLQQAQATLQLRAVELGRAETLNDEREYLRLITAINQGLSNQFTLEERNLRLKAREDIGAAEARHASPAELGKIRGRLDLDISTLATRSRVAFSGIEEQARRVTMGRFTTELQTAVAGANQAEMGFTGLTPEETASGIQRARAREIDLLTLDKARVEVLREQGALTEAQRLALDLLAVAAERALTFKQAELDIDKQDLAVFAARVKTAELQRVALEKSDPLAGLSAGFRDVVDEFTAAGTLMRQGIHSLGSDLARSFSQTFTQVVLGDFKKLAELPRLLALNIVNAFGDVVAKAAIGNLFSSFQQALGGRGGSLFGALGGGGGGGGGVMEVGGQLFQSVAAGGGQTVLVPVGGAGGSGAMGGGGFSLSGLPLPPLGSGSSLFGGTNIGAMWNAPLSSLFSSDVVFSGGQLISNAGELASLSMTSAGIAGESGFFGAGMTLGSTAGLIGGVAGLGFTIFSALQGAPTFQNIAISGVSGALSGAMIGTYIYPGIGTLIGAIAGGLLGGGAAAFGKGGGAKKVSPAERSYQAGQRGRAALASAITGAKSLEEMQAILNGHWSPYNEVNIVSYESPTHWVNGAYTNGPARFLAQVKGNGEGGPPFPDVLVMLQDPRYIDNLEIQVAGPAGSGSASYDVGITTQAQDKWRELLAALADTFVGFRENFGPGFEPLGPSALATTGVGVERFTALSGLAALTRGQGQDIDLSIDMLKRQGLDDDQIEQLIRLMSKVDRDRQLNFFIRPEEFAFG